MQLTEYSTAIKGVHSYVVEIMSCLENTTRADRALGLALVLSLVALVLSVVTLALLTGFTVHFQYSLNQLQQQVDDDREQVTKVQQTIKSK